MTDTHPSGWRWLPLAVLVIVLDQLSKAWISSHFAFGETFTVLGAWDSDPDKGVISYLTPVAMSLLNRKVGDEVEFELHGAKHRHRIEGIETAPVTAPAASAETAAAPATA